MKLIISILLIFYCSNIIAQLDSVLWESIDRTYLVHLPTEYDGTESLPLVIAMHGGFGSAINLENQSQLNLTANEENFIVVFPEGVLGGVFNIRTWNAGYCCGHASASNIDDVGFINKMLDTLISKYSIDTNRIYATGMSNGGFMAYRLACELSDRIAAIAPVAASMSTLNCIPNRSVPVLAIHSYLDTNVPLEGGIGTGPSNHYNSPLDSVMNVWSEYNQCQIKNDTIIDNDEFTHIRWSNCDCSYTVEQYISQDGGHSWPGGEPTPLGDPVSTFINANELMWNFFQEHTLDCISSVTEETSSEEALVYYPNPTNGTLTFILENQTSQKKLTIFDSLGKLVKHTTITNDIDVGQLENGSYFLLLEVNNQKFYRKFIKID